jgi:hypothetical protein
MWQATSRRQVFQAGQASYLIDPVVRLAKS